MPAQKLEIIVENAPRTRDYPRYETIDIYSKGSVALYSGPPPKPFNAEPFINQWVGGNVGFGSSSGVQPYGPYERQTTLPEYDIGTPNLQKNPYEGNDVQVEPYQKGMALEGNFNLYGNSSTAILHDNEYGYDIHHHNRGGGMVKIGDEPLSQLPWGKQKRLDDYSK